MQEGVTPRDEDNDHHDIDQPEQHVCAAQAGFQRQDANSMPEQHVCAKPAERIQRQEGPNHITGQWEAVPHEDDHHYDITCQWEALPTTTTEFLPGNTPTYEPDTRERTREERKEGMIRTLKLVLTSDQKKLFEEIGFEALADTMLGEK